MAALDCFAEPVIGPATSGRTRWLAMTSGIESTSTHPAVQCLAVERRWLERGGVDVAETAHVDGEHLLSVRRLAARERADAAGRAEQVMDRLLAELIVGDRVLALQQPELRRRHERP